MGQAQARSEASCWVPVQSNHHIQCKQLRNTTCNLMGQMCMPGITVFYLAQHASPSQWYGIGAARARVQANTHFPGTTILVAAHSTRNATYPGHMPAPSSLSPSADAVRGACRCMPCRAVPCHVSHTPLLWINVERVLSTGRVCILLVVADTYVLSVAVAAHVGRHIHTNTHAHTRTPTLTPTPTRPQ